MKNRSHHPKVRHTLERLLTLLCLLVLVGTPRAQQPAAATKQSPEDRIALYQALLDLTNPWTVMCIAAHPDDEDGTSLIVMRRKYGAHTVSLFSTFGEGGQNAIGPELYEEMGAIRARETMAAAEIQGSEPHFLGLKDFGYSKSADEAFKFWGHDEALRRMVLEIRKLRADVIITNHSATSNDHGHHQATARLELEAFDAAADPKRFPEQLKDGVTVWQVQRLFVRARGNAQAQADNSPVVTIDPNEQDPVRGVVYAEEALRALQKHATQGPWPKTLAQMAARFANSADGRLPLVRYRLVREAKGAEALPKESHNLLDGLRLPDDSSQRLAPLTASGPSTLGSIDDPERTLQSVLAVAREFHQINKPPLIMTMPRLDFMEKRLFAALSAATRIKVSVVPETQSLIPGTPTKFLITVSNNGNLEAHVYNVLFGGMGQGAGRPPTTNLLAPGQSIRVTREFETPQNANVTVPHHEHLYDGRVFGEKFTATATIAIKGGAFFGEASVPIDVAPPVEIAFASPSLIVLTPATEAYHFPFLISVVNHDIERHTGKLVASRSNDKQEDYGQALSLAPGAAFEVKVPTSNVLSTSAARSFNISISWHDDRKGREAVGQRTVPVMDAEARVAPNLRVGYVRGFDYSLPNALNALGVESKELSVDEVKTADLQKYSTIIVDNRVYESEPELIAANQKLLDYANAGGTLIVFYHKSNEWNPDERRKRPQLAPYKLILGDERITDETAQITFTEPDHPLLNTPNKLGQEDFANWIQERGLYYPKEWDPQYHALLQSNDPGEAPLKGGLLVADYGRGHYIYTSMVWYRELRAGVPGAYRMLANMISYGHESR
jgi:LmbE family N-acetylglucosaminyl deacetylase